jgi:hypothetical protein
MVASNRREPALGERIDMGISKFVGENAPGGVRRALVGAVVGLVMIALAFAGIAASDVSALRTQGYWTLLTIGFAVASLVMDWLHSEHGWRMTKSAMQLALLWVGVFVAIELVYFFIAAGRFTNADTGLVNGLILALGTFACGVYVNWRLMVVGVAVGLATVVAAYVEQYLWVLLGVALVAVAVLVVGARLTAAKRRLWTEDE